MLALVGLPGFVYLQLVPRVSEGPAAGRSSEPNAVLETLFFGVICALGGGLLSAASLPGWWAEFIPALSASDVDPSSNVLAGALAVFTAFAGALLTATALAGLVLSLRRSGFGRRLSTGEGAGPTVLMCVGSGGMLAIWLIALSVGGH